jgi:hypothetical protein
VLLVAAAAAWVVHLRTRYDLFERVKQLVLLLLELVQLPLQVRDLLLGVLQRQGLLLLFVLALLLLTLELKGKVAV